jgi:Major Facilitator Superfamily
MDKFLGLDADRWESIAIAYDFAFPPFHIFVLLVTLVSPRVYFSCSMMIWSIASVMHAISSNFASLCILRVLIAASEANLSALLFYLSTFYKKDELVFRIGIYIATSAFTLPLGGYFSQAILAAGEYRSSLKSWQFLFIIQGILGFLVTLIFWFKLPNGVWDAKGLGRKERRVAQLRLVEPQNRHEVDNFHARDLGSVLRDPIIYVFAILFFAINVTWTSAPVFLRYPEKQSLYAPMPKFFPVLVYELKTSPDAAMLLYIPPYIISGLVAVITAYITGKTQRFRHAVCILCLICSLGYFLAAFSQQIMNWGYWVQYLCILIASSGFYSLVALTVAWQLVSQTSISKKIGGLAALQFVGQWGPSLGVRFFPPWVMPSFSKGLWFCGCIMVATAVTAVLLQTLLSRKKKSASMP